MDTRGLALVFDRRVALRQKREALELHRLGHEATLAQEPTASMRDQSTSIYDRLSQTAAQVLSVVTCEP